MNNIQDIVSQNLVRLRKYKKLTQLELSQKINYSDKAISRWETGEVLPGVDTLNVLSELYEVPISYFFEKHENEKIQKVKKISIGNKMAISLLSIVCVWFIAAIGYTYIMTIGGANAWILFVWAVPASMIVAIVFNGIWGKHNWSFVFISILVWSLLSAFYLQFIKYNMYLIFIIGVPLQVGIILWSFISPKGHGK